MTDAPEVRENRSARRYEVQVGDQLAYLQYRDSASGERVLVHTEVPAPLEGRGLGSRIVKAALEDARAHGRRIVPACPFVASYIERHDEYRDLVAVT
jgi:predicted GNAT family acetyltransferase